MTAALRIRFFLLVYSVFSVSLWLVLFGQNAAKSDAFPRSIDHPQHKLPVRLIVGRIGRRLADLDQHRVLTGLELHPKAMPIQAHAVAILLEAELTLAVDPDREVVIRRAAELDLRRFG